MRVGIITFHASHNYGSMLQAYALQKTVESLGHECEIINFRTKRQREFYRLYGPRTFLRSPKLFWKLLKRYSLFEKFLVEDLVLSKDEYSQIVEIRNARLGYDVFISGSDQIWNTLCTDWDEAYGLGFVEQGRKIAYAPSMGPDPDRQMSVYQERTNLLGKVLTGYDSISVREPKTADFVKQITGVLPAVTLDPTLLLDAKKWEMLENGSPIIRSDYILMYSPWENPDMFRRAIELGRKFNMKIVVTTSHSYYEYRHNPDVIYHIDCGPKEFLNLVRHARLVIGASFHAAAFSIIFGKQLYAFDGMNDSRVASLLSLAGLESFAREPEEILNESRLSQIYRKAQGNLTPAVNRSIDFLRNALADAPEKHNSRI